MSTPGQSGDMTGKPGTADPGRTVEVTAADLPLHCPTPGTPVWKMHPRVFLDVTKTGEVLCPYCGAHYRLTGDAPKGH